MMREYHSRVPVHNWQECQSPKWMWTGHCDKHFDIVSNTNDVAIAKSMPESMTRTRPTFPMEDGQPTARSTFCLHQHTRRIIEIPPKRLQRIFGPLNRNMWRKGRRQKVRIAVRGGRGRETENNLLACAFIKSREKRSDQKMSRICTVIAERRQQQHASSLSSISFDTSYHQHASSSASADSCCGVAVLSGPILRGRTKEMTVLTDAYKHARSQTSAFKPSSRLVIIRGPSGSGKTSICEALRTSTVRDEAFYISVKCDLLHRVHPMYLLVCSLSDLCDILMQQGGSSARPSHITHAITQSLNQEEATILASVAPSIALLTGIKPDSQATCTEASSWKIDKDFSSKLEIACQSLFHAVARPGSPVVLVFDDIQWSDAESIEVVCSLLSCSSLKHLLVVCTHTDQHTSTQLQSLEAAAASPRTDSATTTITGATIMEVPLMHQRLRCLGKSHIGMMLADRLGVRISEAEPLAKLIHRKTNGLPRDVVKFIDELQATNLLVYRSGSWIWDISRIQAETDVSDTVSKSLSYIIDSLSTEMRTFVKIAACLGHTFHLKHFFAVFRSLTLATKGGEEQNWAILRASLIEKSVIACELGVLEKAQPGMLKFADHNIHHHAYTMLAYNTEASSVHLCIGKVIMEIYQREGDTNEDTFFTFVGHLNQGATAIFEVEERNHLVDLNFKAGCISQSSHAFARAVKYYNNGIQLLCESPDYDLNLMMKLKTGLAESQNCCGHFQACHRTLDDVSVHQLSCRNKIQLSFIRVVALRNQGKIGESCNTCLHLLELLKRERFCCQAKIFRVRVAPRLARVVWPLSFNRTDESDILLLPPMKCKRKLLIMMALDILTTNSYYSLHCGDMSDHRTLSLFMFASTQMVKLTLRHGLSEHSSLAFASYAVALSTRPFQQRGSERCSRLALNLLQSDEQGLESTAKANVPPLLMVYSLRWREQHLEHCISPFNAAFGSKSMFGLLGAIWSIRARFSCGRRLDQMTEDTLDLLSIIETKMQAQLAYHLLLPLWQLILTLSTGRMEAYEASVDSLDDIIEEEESSDGSKQALGFHVCRDVQFFQIAVTQCFFGGGLSNRTFQRCRFEQPACSNTVGGTHFTIVERTFFSGLYDSIIAHRCGGGRGISRHIIRSRIKKLKSWFRKGATDCLPMIIILEAEQASLRLASHLVVIAKYEQAIDLCTDHTNLGALANERLATILQDRFHGEEMAGSNGWRVYLSEAERLYRAWGANAKANQLENSMPSCCTRNRKNSSSV